MRRNKSSAFTVFELVIYMGIVALVVPLFFSFFNKTLMTFRENVVRRGDVVRNGIALTLIKRDLMSASMYQHEWDNNHLIFKIYTLNSRMKPVERWVGWFVIKDGLKRFIGQWNPKNKKWITKTVFKYMCSIKTLSVKRYYHSTNGCLQGVEVYCNGGDDLQPVQSLYVALRNRMVN